MLPVVVGKLVGNGNPIASYPHLMRRVPKEAQESGDGRSRAALLVDDWMQAQLDSINAADTIVWRQFSNRRIFFVCHRYGHGARKGRQ